MQVTSNVVKQKQNEINVIGPATSNNIILLNNKENSQGIYLLTNFNSSER